MARITNLPLEQLKGRKLAILTRDCWLVWLLIEGEIVDLIEPKHDYSRSL